VSSSTTVAHTVVQNFWRNLARNKDIEHIGRTNGWLALDTMRDQGVAQCAAPRVELKARRD